MILQSDFSQRLLKRHGNGCDSLLLVTKEHLCHLSVLLLLCTCWHGLNVSINQLRIGHEFFPLMSNREG